MKKKTVNKKRPNIPLGKRGLILCEGETEENYFKGLISHDKNRRRLASVSVEIYKPKDHTPKGLINEAKRKIKEAKSLKNPYHFAYIVFDKDGHQNIPFVFDESVKSKDPQIEIAFTATCFEYFVLLHFEKSAKPCTKCDQVIKQLKEHLPDYEKAGNLYVKLLEYKDVGIANSEWSESNKDPQKRIYEVDAFCNVHRLIKFLDDLNT
ncbi:MAG TPA: RloB family protein [Cytophagaceae bacterium]|jgi:hypothetical protein|nr:RloB family protein [Cytophagaceae bacterium]